MAKGLNLKMLIIGILLGAALFITSVNRDPVFNQISYSSIVLPYGWKPVPDQNACEVSNTGWPLLNWSSDPTCETREVNNLAFILDVSFVAAIYISVATAVVYGLSLAKRSLTHGKK